MVECSRTDCRTIGLFAVIRFEGGQGLGASVMSDQATRAVDLEGFYPLGMAVRYFPRPDGRRISIQSLHRWVGRGVRGVRLQSIRLGQQVCTCDAWVHEFVAALNRG